jgi:hypothetical protein
MDLLVSGICGAGIVLFCESQYSCLRLFRQKTTLFFFMAQLAILTSVLQMILTALIYFLSNLRVLTMLILILIVNFAINISYPIMILLRLKLIQNFSRYIMVIPLILATTFTALKYFWICSILSSGEYCFQIFHIIRLITTTILGVQNIAINIFFILIAIKNFQNIVHTRCTIIVNIIAITLEFLIVAIEFIVNEQSFILYIMPSVVSISQQIKVRLEIEILSYIVQSVHQQQERINNDEFIRNNLNLLEERYK